MDNYEKYKMSWMIQHGYSLQNLVQEIEDLQYEDPDDSDRISTPISSLFEEWEAERGFGSEIWACKGEWEECEGAMASDGDESHEISLLDPYEAYQIRWMIEHNYSLTYLMNLMQQMQNEDPENSDRITTPVTALFAEMQSNGIGFVRSELWLSRSTWQKSKKVPAASQAITTNTIHMIATFWENLMQLLPKQPRTFDTSDDPGFWTDGEMVLCPSEADCNFLCDLLLNLPLGTITVKSGYFDPFEDEEQDDYTGFWYVEIE